MFIKGYTYGYNSGKGAYLTEKAQISMEKLSQTGTEWMCLAFSMSQDTFSSTEIRFDYKSDLTDYDIIFAIEKAKEKQMKVCMKPILNSRDGMWRAVISFPDANMNEKDIYWDAWFESYSAFICHYAQIAERTKCEMFCIGCEMIGTEHKSDHWRALIKRVRSIFSGLLTYNANHGREDNVTWWDALDIMGTSAYYPVATKADASEDDMIKRWLEIKERLKLLYERVQKPILFMEIGIRSASGCAMMPWDFNHLEYPVSEDEQARFYESCFKVFFYEKWFAGFCWWDWSTELYDIEDAQKDTGFNVYGKKAENVIRNWYAKQR